MSDSEQCSNRLQLDLMLILDNFLCELNIIWPFRLNITFEWLQKLNPGYEICIISYQVNLSSEVSAMFSRLMPSLNSRSLPFVVFLGEFPSRCQNLSSGAIRPGGQALVIYLFIFFVIHRYTGPIGARPRVRPLGSPPPPPPHASWSYEDLLIRPVSTSTKIYTIRSSTCLTKKHIVTLHCELYI